MYLYICICIYIYICTCMYIYIYVYVYVYVVCTSCLCVFHVCGSKLCTSKVQKDCQYRRKVWSLKNRLLPANNRFGLVHTIPSHLHIIFFDRMQISISYGEYIQYRSCIQLLLVPVYPSQGGGESFKIGNI